MASDPERLYDTLVQFGHAPLTFMVNVHWKETVLSNRQQPAVSRPPLEDLYTRSRREATAKHDK